MPLSTVLSTSTSTSALPLHASASMSNSNKIIMRESASMNRMQQYYAPSAAGALSDDENDAYACMDTTRRRTAHSHVLSIVVLLFTLCGMYLYASSRSALVKAIRDSSDLLVSSQQLDIQVKSAEKDVRTMNQRLEEFHQRQRAQRDSDAEDALLQQPPALTAANAKDQQEMHEIQNKLTVSAQRAEILTEMVQEMSRQDAIEKYGDHVQRVQIELVFPDGKIGPTKFVLEMAPLEYMPHSVFIFLEMVSNNLLEGCSFILNALHMIKWAPLPYDGSPPKTRAEQFKKKGLQSVAFQEYSPKFPHTKYTIGFAADGSPSFYINTEDNSEIHINEPCFAKIVSGFDAIKRLEKSPRRNGIWFEQRIGIKKAIILPPM